MSNEPPVSGKRSVQSPKDLVSFTWGLKRFARECGADLVGIADLGRLEGIRTEPEDLLEGHTRAVCMAVRLSEGIVDAIVDRPTPLYQQNYVKINALLDDIALRVMQYIQSGGARAVPIPASQVLDKTRWYSYISHKAVAVAAGIGWQGKSLLLINRNHGPRLRLVTVLTDMPLEPDRPVKNLCAKCSACAEACPVGAIKNVNTDLHYKDRKEALHLDRCVARVVENQTNLPFIEAPICGVCIRACPFGRRKKSLRETR
ncbi:MAG: 4Fe-4S dicluster domain-containing protein [Desulfomonilaceae bacterium]|nr:4Fe-4S dicluster domain-containing protein [Desulfomonilaceae bacterium]